MSDLIELDKMRNAARFDDEILELRAKLLGSLLLFTRFFYFLRNEADFIVDTPLGNEGHQIQICRELTKVHRLETRNLQLQIPPGWGKSELCKHFVAWNLANNAKSRILYISCSADLAEHHTGEIKQIILHPLFAKIFNVRLSTTKRADSFFRTTENGTVAAFGADGMITGYDAGLQIDGINSGGIMIDDYHKPKEVMSTNVRESFVNNFQMTIKKRRRSRSAWTVLLGQRLHEEDLAGRLEQGMDGEEWRICRIAALAENGESRCPRLVTTQELLLEKEKAPYVFWSQMQQQPIPAGGALYKEEWFPLLNQEPDVILTFLTIDTAETDKTWNDPTVMNFHGVYKLKQSGVETDEYAILSLDCRQVWIEPKDLESEFDDFYTGCMRYKVKPSFIAIEKKSTGTTLLSILKERQGLRILDIERNGKINNKSQRFVDIQRYISERRYGVMKYAPHAKMIIDHMCKITANQSHAHDDICDTIYDAIKAVFIDKSAFLYSETAHREQIHKYNTFYQQQNRQIRERVNERRNY